MHVHSLAYRCSGSRPTFASGHGQKLSEFTREILGRPAGEGPVHVISGRGPKIPTDWLLSSSCTLCGTKMSEDHILNCRQTHLYRVMRHDAIVCWLYDHLVSRRSAP